MSQLDAAPSFPSGYATPIQSADVARLLHDAYNLPGAEKEGALAMARQALAIAEASAAGDAHTDIALCWHWIGRHALNLGRMDEAERAFRAELSLLDRLVEADHPTRAQSLDHIARALRGAGRLAEALPLYRASLEMRRRIYAGSDHPDLAGSLNNLALAESALGHFAEAEALYLESLEMKRRIYGADDLELATTLSNLGNLLVEQGRLMEAIQWLSEAVSMLLRTVGEESPDPVLPAGIAALARAYRVAGLYDAAVRLAEDVLRRRALVYVGDHAAIASATAELGRLYWKIGRREEGERLLRDSLAMHRRLFPAGHPSLASSMFELGRVLQETGGVVEADALLSDALQMLRRVLGASHHHAAVMLIELARVRIRRGRLDSTEELLREASTILDAGRDHPFNVIALRASAELAERKGEYVEAVRHYSDAADMLERIFPHGHPDRTAILQEMSALARQSGFFAEAAEVPPSGNG